MNELYRSKYFKYRQKTLQQSGGELNINGPIHIVYFSNATTNKKIIVLGDMHEKYKICEDNAIFITKYLESLSKSIKFNFYIETEMPTKYELLNNKINRFKYLPADKEHNAYIADVIDFGITNYKKIDNIKIHFGDVRHDIIGFETFKNYTNQFDLLNNINVLKDYYNLFSHYRSFLNIYHYTVLQIYFFFRAIIENKPEEEYKKYIFYTPDYFYKLVIKTLKTHPKECVTLLEVLIEILRIYFNKIFDDNIFIGINDLGNLESIYQIGIKCTSSITDFYVISKIIRDTDSNNILYVGNAHIDYIKIYLQNIGFTIDTETSTDDDYLQCIKNIKPFDEFFKIS